LLPFAFLLDFVAGFVGMLSAASSAFFETTSIALLPLLAMLANVLLLLPLLLLLAPVSTFTA
jgi:hypothetical protein